MLLVLDGKQGVNTEEQVNLLKFAKECVTNKRDIPILILLNKMDGPDKDEMELLFAESQREVEKIFEVTDRRESLQSMFSASSSFEEKSLVHSPALISFSAIHAFIYRAASTMDFSTFQTKVEKGLIERLGQEAFGFAWEDFEEDEKPRKVYEIIRSPKHIQRGLQVSRFHHLLSALTHFVGGREKQTKIIMEQLEILTNLMNSESNYVSGFVELYQKKRMLGESNIPEAVDGIFAKLHQESVQSALVACKEDPSQIHMLGAVMKDIDLYIDLLVQMKALTSERCVGMIALAKKIALSQLEGVLYPGRYWYCTITSYLGSFDWMAIYSSMSNVLFGNPLFFDEHFGIITFLIQKEIWTLLRSHIPDDEYAECHLHDIEDGRFILKAKNQGKLKVSMPDSPSDPTHFGHVLWMYERIVGKVERLLKETDGSSPKDCDDCSMESMKVQLEKMANEIQLLKEAQAMNKVNEEQLRLENVELEAIDDNASEFEDPLFQVSIAEDYCGDY